MSFLISIGSRPRRLSLAVVALLAAVPASAAAATGPTCNAPALSQVFSWAQDANWYAALPGVSWDGLSTAGWTLSGGAKLVNTTLADGQTGAVLDLPSGATATSAQMCLSNSYPTFRSEIKNVKGSSGVSVSVAYYSSKGWGQPQLSGSMTGVSNVWTLPAVVNVKASSVSGWQYGRFKFAANGASSEYQLSNLYADPRMVS